MQKNITQTALSILCILILSIISPVNPVFASTTNQKQNILLIFPQFENLSLTDRRVVAGIKLAFENDQWAKQNLNLIESKATTDIPSLIRLTLTDIDKFKPALIIGAVTSNIALAISEAAETKKIPFISPFATNPKVTENKKFTFTTCFDDNFQASTLARHIWSEGRKSGILLNNQNSAYSIGFINEFKLNFEKSGGTTRTISFDSSQDDILSKISNDKNAKFDFVLIPSYQLEAANILAKIFPKYDSSIHYYGGDSWGGGAVFHSIVKELGDSFKGQYVQHWSQNSSHKENIQFLKMAKSSKIDDSLKGDTTAMNAPIAMGYDAALTALSALKTSNLFDSSSIAAAIRKTNIVGASGRINYTNNRNSPIKGLFIYKITNGSESFFKFVPGKAANR